MLESGIAYNELKGLVVEGDAEMDTSFEATLDVMARVTGKYTNLEGDPGEGTRRMAAKRVVIRIHPKNVRSWDHSKLG
jgi:hypothetical protein